MKIKTSDKNKKCAAEATHKKHTARLRHTSFNTQQGYAKMSLRFYQKTQPYTVVKC